MGQRGQDLRFFEFVVSQVLRGLDSPTASGLEVKRVLSDPQVLFGASARSLRVRAGGRPSGRLPNGSSLEVERRMNRFGGRSRVSGDSDCWGLVAFGWQALGI